MMEYTCRLIALTILLITDEGPRTETSDKLLRVSMFLVLSIIFHRMWAASTQHFNALLQLDPNNTQARIHRARAQYKLVCTDNIIIILCISVILTVILDCVHVTCSFMAYSINNVTVCA